MAEEAPKRKINFTKIAMFGLGPVLLLGLVVLVFYMFSMSDMFTDLAKIDSNPGGFLANIFSWIFGLMFVYILMYTLLSMSSLYFIKSY